MTVPRSLTIAVGAILSPVVGGGVAGAAVAELVAVAEVEVGVEVKAEVVGGGGGGGGGAGGGGEHRCGASVGGVDSIYGASDVYRR